MQLLKFLDDVVLNALQHAPLAAVGAAIVSFVIPGTVETLSASILRPASHAGTRGS